MNKALTVLLFSLFVSLTDAVAQADLTIFGSASPIGMEERGMSFTVRNNGTVDSQPFKIKVWVSIDATRDELDLPSTSREFAGLRPYDPANGVRDGATGVRVFSFPLPLQSSTQPRLVGDTLSPADWLGKSIYVKGCIAADLVNFDECSEFSRLVAPPRPNFTVSSGVSRDFVEIIWPPIKPDDARPMVDSYIIREIPYTGLTRNFTEMPNSIPLITDSDQVQKHRFEVDDIDSGKRYFYDIQSCHDTSSVMPICAPIRRRPIGNSLADYVATIGTEPRGIRIDWEEFNPGGPGYELERCLEGQTDGCTRILRKGVATTYLDMDVDRAKNYEYTIFACQSYSFVSDPTRCSSPLYRQAVTNAGTSGLVDDYEDDDNAAQATPVRNTVSQLHSFDTNDDEDWAEIILSKPQVLTITTSGDTFNDTELTLFAADGATQIAYNNNPDGQTTAYAAIVSDVLPAGRYFLKVNQRANLPALYKPVANYRLDIEITERIILAPIIDLLLGN